MLATELAHAAAEDFVPHPARGEIVSKTSSRGGTLSQAEDE